MSAATETCAKRWCFTINNPTDEDKFWENDEQREQLEYLIVQHEVGEQGTPHYQGFLILKRKNRLSWLKKNINSRAHWEKTRGTDQQAADYCRKDDTHPEGSLRFELGTLKTALKRKERDELEEAVIEEVKKLQDEGFRSVRDIDPQVLARPGFMAAYNALTADLLGVYRPELKIITMVGPPGTGKSFAINSLFPQAGKSNHGQQWDMVQQSNSNSHGVRGVRRADPTAENAQTARSLSNGTRGQGRDEACDVHSRSHHQQHQA